MNRRSEILRATAEAANLIARFPMHDRTSFDVVGAANELDIPVLFRPLVGLWGAAVAVGNGIRGVLVTTKLGLAVQRFTLAHELGHVLLGHESSFDETVGFAGRFGPAARPTQEIAADTFASELLASRASMLAASQVQGWTKAVLEKPGTVYQLSLRLGVSYQATCWALAAQRVVTATTAARLASARVQDLKRRLAPGHALANSWADVWRIAKPDSGAFVEGGPDDVFAVELQDNASAGYIWQVVDVGSSAEIVDERYETDEVYGQNTSRTIWLRFAAAGVHRLVFEHTRPWNKSQLEHIDVSIDNFGKEGEGRARRHREKALADVST